MGGGRGMSIYFACFWQYVGVERGGMEGWGARLAPEYGMGVGWIIFSRLPLIMLTFEMSSNLYAICCFPAPLVILQRVDPRGILRYVMEYARLGRISHLS